MFLTDRSLSNFECQPFDLDVTTFTLLLVGRKLNAWKPEFTGLLISKLIFIIQLRCAMHGPCKMKNLSVHSK